MYIVKEKVVLCSREYNKAPLGNLKLLVEYMQSIESELVYVSTSNNEQVHDPEKHSL